MNIKVSTERFDIISSGSVIIPANDYVEFEIENLRFRINMIQNDNEAIQGTIQTNLEQDDRGQCMIISLVNFSTSFFATPNQELRLAYLNRKDLYLRFSLISINRMGNRYDGLLFYTWMWAKQENVVNPNDQDNASRQ